MSILAQQRATILVIDDYTEIRETLSYILEAEGYAVLTAVDGVDALEKLQGLSPTLIIVDLMMPRMDGFTFVQKLRQQSSFSELPVIAITAHDIRRDDLNDLDVQASLGKPFDLDDLLREIGRLIHPSSSKFT